MLVETSYSTLYAMDGVSQVDSQNEASTHITKYRNKASLKHFSPQRSASPEENLDFNFSL